ncbi:MAG: ABC transporter ATP-binding protein, partial [Prochloraceae cyanobacterium]|nr:ABC transporter ATP-binding protein [Prochloraceae cyanobacterium]
EPWPLKFIFDRILVSESDIGSVHLVLGQEVPPLVLLSGLTLAIVAIALLRALATYISKLSMAMVAVRVLAEIRSQLYSHLQRLSLSFHNQYKRGDLISRVTADIENIRNGTIDAIVPFAINTVALVGMIVVMFFINWELAAIALILFPVFLFVANNLIARIRRSVRKHRQSEGLIASTTSDTIGAIKIVQALSLHNALERMFLEQNRNNLDLGTESLKISALLLRTVQVLVAMTIAIVLWRGAILVIDKSLSPGDLLVFISYLKNSFEPPLRKFANQTGAIAKTIASGERVVDILEYEPNVRNLPKAKEAHPFFGAVRFKNVKFGYEANREILRDLNFEVEAGQKITIVGPSGSGKSTLMSLMLRLYDPVRGSILIDGQDLREYTLESLRSQISVVLQDSCLFAASIKENIAYGNLQACQKEIEKAASLANAHEFILNLPQGYDTILGEGGASLSGGQRQRIAIA